MSKDVRQYHNIKVLYLEDDPFSREKLLRILNRRFRNIIVATDGDEGYQLYQTYRPDLIITDLKVNQMNGLEMIRKIREQNDNVQIIITTAHDDNDIFIQSIENNVNHFILKPIDLDRLLLAIQKSVHHIQLEKELTQQNLELENERRKNELFPIIDPLTSIFNRLTFDKLLTSELEKSKQYEQSISVILIDIDNFKKINEQFGYEHGDKILVTISTILQQRISEYDILARWEGNTFILLTPQTDLKNAKELAHSIKSLIECFHFQDALHLTCSIGISEFSPEKGKSKKDLLLDAEHALFQSKKNGKNCVSIF
ncbi:diguanylate cyclase domain-containing protein [Neobacillus sp. PS3-40]|uniref:diguanylate cyclase domain-containing protein n=1 Tax=Neobacillus sp. PS3-40 TaxID=3070679 RepID=UPI0027E20229|nr:diguanylate cyclase [Neobacillus sp. PS3-40]WML44494.1 diguanylate cyclase [Neobacillus sp. PS3-40]